MQFLVKAVSLLCVPGSAWEAEECGEEGSEHLWGARVRQRQRHQLCERSEQAEHQQQDEHRQQAHTTGQVHIDGVQVLEEVQQENIFKRVFFNIVCLLRSASKDRLNASKGEKEKPTPAQHNAKFDQMFDKAGTAEAKSSTPGPTAPARPSASTVPRPAAAGSSSTLPRTYRRFWFLGLESGRFQGQLLGI